MKVSIPNILSIIRVLAAPCIAIAFMVFERPMADQVAILIFVGAAATDYLDGLLARVLCQESAFGRMLDPIADKAMVMIALAVLISLYKLSWPILAPAVMIILREVLISGLREFLGEIKLEVTRLAKWKTTLQMLSIGLLLAQGAITPDDSSETISPIVAKVMTSAGIAAGGIGLLLLWIAAWFTVVTGWDYFRKGLPYIREKEAAGGTVVAASEDGPAAP